VNSDLIDFSTTFSLDASAFTVPELDASSLSYEIGSPFLSDFTTYKLTVDYSGPIEPSTGCFIKYTFPAEIDISEVDASSITGTGLLVDQDGLS
jgi:hypothetical protein